MPSNIIIAGSGFAGTWAALAVARAVALAGKEGEITLTLVAPAPQMCIRPRLYEAVIENIAPDVRPDLGPVLRPVIESALAECGADVMTGAGVAALDANGVTLSNGVRDQ